MLSGESLPKLVGVAPHVFSFGKSLPKPTIKESYFATCERDEGGHCLPSGESGSSKNPKFVGTESDENSTKKEKSADDANLKKPKNLTFKGDGDIKKIAKKFFEKDVDEGMIGALCNAIDGAEIRFSIRENTIFLGWNSNVDGISARRSFTKENGKIIAENIMFSIADNSPYKGKGVEFFANQVKAMQSIGIKEIKTTASGHYGSKFNGYYTWPLMGYDGILTEEDFLNLPKKFRSEMGASNSILDLMALPGGKEAWKEHGNSIYNATFDLKPGSRSMKVLEAYIEERKNRGKNNTRTDTGSLQIKTKAQGTGGKIGSSRSYDGQETGRTDSGNGNSGGTGRGLGLKTLSSIKETTGGALVAPAKQKRVKESLFFNHIKSIPKPTIKESYFATCERDEGGHCLPSGESGSEKPEDKTSSDLTPEIQELVKEWVSNNEKIKNDPARRKQLNQLASTSNTKATQLERIVNGKMPAWKEGEIIDLDASSFTRAKVSKNEDAGQLGYKYSDSGMIFIEKPTKGYDIPYKDLNLNHSNEQETIVAGKYRVKRRGKITEPGTNRQYGHKIPAIILEEINQKSIPISHFKSYLQKQWVTMGGSPCEEGEHCGGTPVELDGEGNITKGPKSTIGKKPSELSKKPAPKPPEVKPSKIEASKPKPVEKQPDKPKIEKKHKETDKKPDNKPKPDYVGKEVEPFDYQKRSDSIKKMQKKSEHYLDKIVRTPEEAAIVGYTKSDYIEINESMRMCPPKFDCLPPTIKKKADAIEKAIDKAPPFDPSIPLYRGVSLQHGSNQEKKEKLLYFAQLCLEYKIPYPMESITSTSINPMVATGFGQSVIYQVRTKKGLYVDPISGNKGEQEVLLSPKSNYKVVAVEDVVYPNHSGKSKIKTIYLEEV